MLRITKRGRKDHWVFVLEGRLAGDWVQELVLVTREFRPGIKALIDIEHVHYVDALGEKALHWLNRLGAAFIAQNTYGVHLCDRLELRRQMPTESEPKKQKRSSKDPKGSADFCPPPQRPSVENSRHS